MVNDSLSDGADQPLATITSSSKIYMLGVLEPCKELKAVVYTVHSIPRITKIRRLSPGMPGKVSLL